MEPFDEDIEPTQNIKRLHGEFDPSAFSDRENFVLSDEELKLEEKNNKHNNRKRIEESWTNICCRFINWLPVIFICIVALALFYTFSTGDWTPFSYIAVAIISRIESYISKTVK